VKADNEPVRTYLISRGCAAHVIRKGLPGLVTQWGGIVDAVEAGNHDESLDEWLNDMDVRDIIAGALAAADEQDKRAAAAEVEGADVRFRVATVPCSCVWGDDVADTNSWRPEWQWWYFRRPAQLGEALREDLLVNGLIGEDE
jgi:hypothetical protein